MEIFEPIERIPKTSWASTGEREMLPRPSETVAATAELWIETPSPISNKYLP